MAHYTQPPWWLRRDLTPVGKLLADYARDQGFSTQQEFALHIGIKQQSLSEYLAPNGRIPRQRALIQIAHATDIPLATLYYAAGNALYRGKPELPPPPPPRIATPQDLPPDTPRTPREALFLRIKRLPISREEREAILADLEQALSGRDPHQKYIIAEHVVPEFPPAPVQPESAPGQWKPVPVTNDLSTNAADEDTK